jgi:hypothetical protein
MLRPRAPFLVVCLLTTSLLSACQGGASRSLPVERPGAAGPLSAPPGVAGAVTPREQGLARATLAVSPATGSGAAGTRGGAGGGRQTGPGAASRLTPPPLPPFTPGVVATQIGALPTPSGGLPLAPAALTPGAVATLQKVEVSPELAAQVLAAAIQPLKGQAVRVTGAVGYAGSGSVTLPEVIEQALDGVVSAGGTAYYGIYQGVNQAVIAQAAGANANGTLTALVEIQRAYPSDGASAQSQLAALFPGATCTQPIAAPAGVPELAHSYLFYGAAAETSFLGGFIQYEGISLAFVLAGKGSLQTTLALP